MSAISARGLRKTFRTGFFMRPVEAVRGVDLEVKEGEIFGFIGPNGAGKTTTIKMLTGLILPSGGEAWIHGVRVPHPESRRSMGFMPEGTYFHEYLTGREFLEFHGRLLGVPGKIRADAIPRLLHRVGLARAADLRIRRYSKGMRQRVGLAQALIGDPDLLVLDEPMSGLDPIGRKDVRELILSLRDEGKTIFFTSHILADAELICDQAAIILGGRIVEQGYLEDLLGQEIEGVDLVVEGIDEALYEELARQARRAVVQSGRFLFQFLDEALAEKALEAVRDCGGRVRSLVPRRRNLEDLLVSDIRRESVRTKERE
jgi:ABC-2 type transport system ATP-binding protein